MEAGAAATWDEFTINHPEGSIVRGVVSHVSGEGPFDFIAHVDLGGIEGTISPGEVPWVFHQACQPPAGTKVYCVVLRIDRPTRRVALSGPIWNYEQWQGIESRYPPGSCHAGEVVYPASFGTFVRLEPGVEGLAEGTQLLAAGSRVMVVVLSVSELPQKLLLSVVGNKQAEPLDGL